MFCRRANLVVSFLVLALVLTLVAGCAFPGGQSSQSPEEFYNGKVIKLITGGTPGGGFDAYPRLMAPFLKKYIPGSTIEVVNILGAGMLLSHNEIYGAKPDGLTIGIMNVPGALFAGAAGNLDVKYDIGKFTWLARAGAEGRVLAAGADNSVKSGDDLMKLGRPFKIAFSGLGSDDYYISYMVFNALGIPMMAVPGYAGIAESTLGVARGEVDGIQGSNSSILQGVRNGTFRPILIMANEYPPDLEPELKGVALAGSLVKDPSKKEFLTSLVSVLAMDRSYAGPPGIPADRVKYLRDAFKKTFSDPEFVALMAKSNRPIAYLEGEKLADMATVSMKSIDSLKTVIAASMAK